ncbi:hypothetical protein AGMMS49592_2090 [Endomicrobiia bacterium]|nr:hypothetical protein AGMMS49592_2090 [Endomicrobiia bacterium]
MYKWYFDTAKKFTDTAWASHCAALDGYAHSAAVAALYATAYAEYVVDAVVPYVYENNANYICGSGRHGSAIASYDAADKAASSARYYASLACVDTHIARTAAELVEKVKELEKLFKDWKSKHPKY